MLSPSQSYFQVLVLNPILVLLVKIVTPTGGTSDPSVTGLIYQVVIAAGSHLFPFRTEKLSPPAPMVLQCNAGE